MSTKIYNAYRLPNMSFFDFNAKVIAFRTDTLAVMKQLVAREAARRLVVLLDAIALGQETPDPGESRSAFQIVTRQLLDDARLGETSQLVGDGEDFRLSISVFPQPTAILVKLHTQHSEYLRAFERIFQPAEYHYQTSSERPTSVSAAEWKQRRRDWDQALPDGIAAHSGPEYLFATRDDVVLNFPSQEEVLAEVLGREARVRNAAENQLFAAKTAELQLDISSTFQALRDFRQWLTSSDGQRALQVAMAQVDMKLRHIGQNTLNSTLSALSQTPPRSQKTR